MRTIVVLLIAALFLTPTLAHATGGGEGGLALLAFPVLVILLVVYLTNKYPVATEPPSSPPGSPSESPSSTIPAPAIGSDR